LKDTVIRQASGVEDIEQARVLIREYVASLNVSLCFQNCDAELAGLPGAYAPPKGGLFLAFDAETAGGCIALRPLEQKVCEMKRLYVRPACRGRGVGRRLVEALIEDARRIGYDVMRLDTLASLKPALELYRSFGFRTVPAYYPNPLPDVIYLELDLR
jgi:putative acetyltransferase